MMGFYSVVFNGSLNEAKKYLEDNFYDRKWDCPTGEEDLEGIIDVISCCGDEVSFEIDYDGNIRCAGDTEAIANIVEY